jgi:predicted RNA-binding Zn-ribbon protein involved in translation (DUF1610 family)
VSAHMRQITLEQFHAEIKAQNAASKEDITFVCPMCGTHQSARDLIDAGAGATFDEVEKYLAFSCVGRFTNAGAPRRQPDGRPCNWTLGGLFQTHSLEVLHEGKAHPRFELAERPKIAAAQS